MILRDIHAVAQYVTDLKSFIAPQVQVGLTTPQVIGKHAPHLVVRTRLVAQHMYMETGQITLQRNTGVSVQHARIINMLVMGMVCGIRITLHNIGGYARLPAAGDMNTLTIL